MRQHQVAQARWLAIAWCLGFVLWAQQACKKAEFEHDGGQQAGNRDGSAAKDAPNDATKPGTCPASTPSHSKAKGQSCSCNRECQTDFCVDGVCCGSACTDTCKACNLPSSLGDCAFVPAGALPSGSSMCAASTPATCGLDGTCDGKGGCRKYVHGTECKAGACDGDAVVGIGLCDGVGNCSESKSQPCPPYTCDKNTNRCASRCSSDDQCSAGHQCSASSCGKSTNGAVCDDASGCLSGFCVDGVCCNIACSGPCVSCKETGSVGHCSYIGNELPDPDCKGEDRATCRNTGLCDGAGRCTLYLQGTPCSLSTCADLIENTQMACDGHGSCQPSQVPTINCAPFLCSNGSCETSCDPKSTDGCEQGHACVPVGDGTRGVCGKRKNGQACQSTDDCESGHCVDGVCCESSCEGPCRSCNLAGSPGLCLNAAAGAQDPRSACRDLGVEMCSTDGRCDGNGGCEMYKAGASCKADSCAGATRTSFACQDGLCQPAQHPCDPYKCNGNACFGSCTGDTQCTDGNFCQKASCGLKPNGTDCSESAECKSGFCAQGVCCNSACTDACMACNLAATAGTCKPVDNAPDPQGKCQASAVATCGTTGTCRAGACAIYDKGTPCKAPVCAGAASLTPASTCDGKGTCTPPAADRLCGLHICKDGACKIPCTGPADCVAPATCVNGTCVAVTPGTGGHGAGGSPGTGGRAAGGAPGTGGNGTGGATGTGGVAAGGAPGTGGSGTGGTPGTGGNGTGGAPGSGGAGEGGAPGTGGAGQGGAPGTGGAGEGGAPGTGGAGEGGAPGTGGAGEGGAPGTGGAGEGGAPGTGGAGEGGAPGTGGAGEGGAPGTGGAGEGGAPGIGGAPGTAAPLIRAFGMGGTPGSSSDASLLSAIWNFFFD